MKKSVALAAAALVWLAVGCVIETKHTIEAHITLDIRHIEEQASGMLDYIEKKSDTLPGLEPAPAPSSMLHRVLDALDPMSAAYADELKTGSPLVTEIAERLRQRNDAIATLKKQGYLGENNRGYVELRESKPFTTQDDRNAAQQLLAEENKDRKALYKELARINEDAPGMSVSVIEKVYANQRLKRATSGDLFQLPDAGPDFDALKASPLGAKLGAQCVAGAWVTMP
mgnify:CR=1 FL=1